MGQSKKKMFQIYYFLCFPPPAASANIIRNLFKPKERARMKPPPKKKIKIKNKSFHFFTQVDVLLFHLTQLRENKRGTMSFTNFMTLILSPSQNWSVSNGFEAMCKGINL